MSGEYFKPMQEEVDFANSLIVKAENGDVEALAMLRRLIASSAGLADAKSVIEISKYIAWVAQKEETARQSRLN